MRVLRRAKERREPLGGPMRTYLLTGDLAKAVAAREPGSTGFGGGVYAVLCGREADYRAAWEAHRSELLEAARPAHPWALYEYESSATRPPVPDADDDLDNQTISHSAGEFWRPRGPAETAASPGGSQHVAAQAPSLKETM